MAVRKELPHLLRYPGGKRRLAAYLAAELEPHYGGASRYVEPFVGGASVFLAIRPSKAVLADINADLIDLLRGIRRYPADVWMSYKGFGRTKAAFNEAKRERSESLPLARRAARLLYLNRTCFKGMWRHNANGEFNVGYGGQSRRWVVTEDYLRSVANALRKARLVCSDFEDTIDGCGKGDFVFLDPPYRPGERELTNQHYVSRTFRFEDHQRLASALRRATKRGCAWAMTTSGHKDLTDLYAGYKVRPIKGSLGTYAGEVLITTA